MFYQKQPTMKSYTYKGYKITTEQVTYGKNKGLYRREIQTANMAGMQAFGGFKTEKEAINHAIRKIDEVEANYKQANDELNNK